jgi:peptidoglycan/LPS O-acetylase OafA/YrhL
MVAGHVIGDTAQRGLMVADDSGWRLFYLALADLRMPLFAALSGYVYAYRPVAARDGLRSLVRGKVRRLLVPYLVVGTAFVLVQLGIPGVNQRPRAAELPALYLYGNQHLWFLQALFVIFVLVAALGAFGRLATFRSWLAVTVASGVLFVVVHVPQAAAVFSINGTVRLLPFFLLGYGAHRFADVLLRPRVLVASTVAFVPAYLLRLWTIVEGSRWAWVPDRALSLSVAVLLLMTLLAVRHRLTSRPLVWIGGFSFAIYLLHVFGAAGARILLNRLGIENTGVLFASGLLAGVVLPIAFELLFGRNRLISWGVLGQKPSGGGAGRAVATPTPTASVPTR